MSKFRCQWTDEIKSRTIEKPEGPYLVCLEGYFDFNEALMKLMVANGSMLPNSSQFEPYSESDDDSDMDFNEPQFDDVCDAIEEANNFAQRFRSLLDEGKKAEAAALASRQKAKGKGDDFSSPKPKSETVDPSNEFTE